MSMLVMACEHAPPPAASTVVSTAPASGWVRVLHGELVDVEVERVVYDAGEPQHFHGRVQVRNLTATPVAIDLRGRRPGIYVNQWEVSDRDHRTVVDEERVSQAPLDAAAPAELRAAMASGGLTTIPAGGALDRYGSFNASGRLAVDAARTDDLRIGDDEADRVVAIRTPLAWQPVLAACRTDGPGGCDPAPRQLVSSSAGSAHRSRDRSRRRRG